MPSILYKKVEGGYERTPVLDHQVHQFIDTGNYFARPEDDTSLDGVVIPKADLEVRRILMSYAEVKALAKSKGINPFGKSKVALLTELGEHNEQEED